jgi:hypothetical protein
MRDTGDSAILLICARATVNFAPPSSRVTVSGPASSTGPLNSRPSVVSTTCAANSGRMAALGSTVLWRRKSTSLRS